MTNVVEYSISTYFLLPMFCGDYSGLSDEETSMLDNWVTAQTEGINRYHFDVDSESPSYFAKCSITGLYAENCTLRLVIMG